MDVDLLSRAKLNFGILFYFKCMSVIGKLLKFCIISLSILRLNCDCCGSGKKNPEGTKPENDEKNPKPENPKSEIPNPEGIKHENPKPKGPKHEIPKPKNPKHEIPKPKNPKPENPKPKDTKPENPNPEIPKPKVKSIDFESIEIKIKDNKGNLLDPEDFTDKKSSFDYVVSSKDKEYDNHNIKVFKLDEFSGLDTYVLIFKNTVKDNIQDVDVLKKIVKISDGIYMLYDSFIVGDNYLTSKFIQDSNNQNLLIVEPTE